MEEKDCGFFGKAYNYVAKLISPPVPEEPEIQNERVFERESKLYALVINVLHNRSGAETDDRALNNLFSLCNVNFLRCRSQSRNGIMKTVKQFKDELEKNKGKIDGCMVFLMGHGTNVNEWFQTSDEKEMNLHRDLVNELNRPNCPSLVGVPKAFFVNICRGDKHDKDLNVDSIKVLEWVELMRKSYETDGDESSGPSYKDTLICFSTYLGHYSYRTIDGTIFIQTLCKVWTAMVKNKPTDILDIITEVNSQMSEKKVVEKYWQCANYWSINYQRNKLILGTSGGSKRVTLDVSAGMEVPKIPYLKMVKSHKFASFLCNDSSFVQNWEISIKYVLNTPPSELLTARNTVNYDRNVRLAIRNLIDAWISGSKTHERTVGIFIDKLKDCNEDNSRIFTRLIEKIQKEYDQDTVVEEM